MSGGWSAGSRIRKRGESVIGCCKVERSMKINKGKITSLKGVMIKILLFRKNKND